MEKVSLGIGRDDEGLFWRFTPQHPKARRFRVAVKLAATKLARMGTVIEKRDDCVVARQDSATNFADLLRALGIETVDEMEMRA